LIGLRRHRELSGGEKKGVHRWEREVTVKSKFEGICGIDANKTKIERSTQTGKRSPKRYSGMRNP